MNVLDYLHNKTVKGDKPHSVPFYLSRYKNNLRIDSAKGTRIIFIEELHDKHHVVRQYADWYPEFCTLYPEYLI